MLDEIRIVLFDAVGTLIEPTPPAAQVYLKVARRFGSVLTEDDVRARFQAALIADQDVARASGDWATSPALERDRWRRIVARVFHELPHAADRVFPELWRHFAQPGSWRAYPDVAAAWEQLRQQGFALGIASNFDQRLVDISRSLPPLNDADWVFHSAELGSRKPGRAFFASIQQRIPARGSEILLVGDDWRDDYQAARQAGWYAVWIDRSAPNSAGDRLNSLESLTDYLKAS